MPRGGEIAVGARCRAGDDRRRDQFVDHGRRRPLDDDRTVRRAWRTPPRSGLRAVRPRSPARTSRPRGRAPGSGRPRSPRGCRGRSCRPRRRRRSGCRSSSDRSCPIPCGRWRTTTGRVGAGDATVTCVPSRPPPRKRCERPTTNRPRVDVTLTARIGSPCAPAPGAPRSITRVLRAGTVRPLYDPGAREPSRVANSSDATTVWSYGLARTIWSRLPSTVNPSARYHVSDVALAHAAVLLPLGWTACCSTSAPPPSTSTTAPTIWPGKRGVEIDGRHRPPVDGEVQPAVLGLLVVARGSSRRGDRRVRLAITIAPPTSSSRSPGRRGRTTSR